MKILILINRFTLGGAQHQALLLASYLHRQKNYEVAVWALEGGGGMEDQLRQEGIPYRDVQFDFTLFFRSRWGKLRSLVPFIRAARKEKFEIFLPFTHYPNLVAGLTWRFSGVKTCYWNDRGQMPNIPVTGIEQLASRMVKNYITNSEAGRGYLSERLGIPAGDIHVILNGFVPRPHDPESDLRNRLGINSAKNLAVMAANFYPLKDHITLIHAWARVKQKFPHSVLLLAGYAPDENILNKVKAQVLDLGLAESVRFLGSYRNIPALLEQADLGVLSTHGEGTSNTLLEYMYARLPVAATDLPEVREVLHPLNRGYLHPPHDESRLADTIIRFFTDPSLSSEVGDHNKDFVIEKYNPERMYQAYHDLFQGRK